MVNLSQSYQQLRAGNVLGTQEILRLASFVRSKPVHYISTYAVNASPENLGQTKILEGPASCSCQSLATGYWRSKWVAEQLIDEARARGLIVSVYRLGNVTGDSKSGVSNTGDLLHTLMLSCHYLGCAPGVDHNITIDVTPVDFVAQAIVELSQRPPSWGKTFHLMNPEPLELEQLTEWLQMKNLALDHVPFEQWQAGFLKLADLISSEALAFMTESWLMSETDNPVPIAFRLRFDCHQAVEHLAGSHVSCPRPDDALLSCYLQHLRDTGVMDLVKRESVVA